jgi:hypothetical protein
MTKRRHDLPPDSLESYDSAMPQIDSDAFLKAQSSSRTTIKRRAPTRSDEAQSPRNIPEIQPLPRWMKGGAGAQDNAPDRVPGDAANAHFFAGAGLARLDHILRGGEGGTEPVFVGALRQHLALR